MLVLTQFQLVQADGSQLGPPTENQLVQPPPSATQLFHPLADQMAVDIVHIYFSQVNKYF